MIQGRPEMDDLATLLAHAMLQPLNGTPARPRQVQVRGHRQWQPLFPQLAELEIAVKVQRELPGVERVYAEYVKKLRAAQREGMIKPKRTQQAVEQLFPTVANWVNNYGSIEIGAQDWTGFAARALDEGGLVFEDKRPETLAEALAALEHGIAEYMAQ
jgi:hypothetical protein